MNPETHASREPGATATRNRYAAHPRIVRLAQFALVFAAAMFISWLLWGGHDASEEKSSDADAVADAAAGPTAWTCSMHPQIRQPKPGDCPICGMDLIAVTQTAGGMRTLALSPEAAALMNIEVAPVERRYVPRDVRMVGRVDYDETRLGYITAWVSGRLDRLYVDYTGVEIRQGDHLADIYSEQLYAAQQELIQAEKFNRSRAAESTTIKVNLVESAREKLRLLGLTEEQIAEIEKRDAPSDHITIHAPMGGIVIEKLKQQGERVALGERIYTIADLSQVWVHLDAYESDLPWIRYGQDVTITTEAYPGDEFHGRIAFVQPVLDDKTRTVKVRVNVPNGDGKLKPDMFVRAVVRPVVAAGGKVMDPSLAGKWISPMHPEIVKDEPGQCDICGMPLVRAESLGYVTPSTDSEEPPLVVPYLAALVTGTRAIVYVQLPNMPSFAEPAFLTLSAVVQEGDLEKIREAFTSYNNMLDRPYDQPGTAFARNLWNDYADRLAEKALAGYEAGSAEQAKEVLADIEATMTLAREQFAPANNPTFEGREIVLGPRAGEYYLVRNGLHEGEMVVTRGNFKLDSEIQIQAKPSMMTPEGGGGGGHDHGGQGELAEGKSDDPHAGHPVALPPAFRQQLLDLAATYDKLAAAVQDQDLDQVTTIFRQLGEELAAVDDTEVTGHPRMLWKEFAMLFGNDVVEGTDADQMVDANRAFLTLKGHVRRMREQLGLMQQQDLEIERIEAPAEFQGELAGVWKQYLNVQRALAADDFKSAQDSLGQFNASLNAVNDTALEGPAKEAWQKEQANLEKLIASLKQAEGIEAMRETFYPASQEIGVLAKTFGFGQSGPIFELHCSMAFQGRGATWYQDNDDTLNPYFGAAMLKCADRVEKVSHSGSKPSAQAEPHTDHSHP